MNRTMVRGVVKGVALSVEVIVCRSVTGILVRGILVRGTKIFSGKLVRPDRFFREKWSASGKLVRIMVRP